MHKTKYPITLYCDHPEVHFDYRVVTRMVKVSEEFIHQCEIEELVYPRVMLHGRKGLCREDVYKLKLIRHLHKDMGLDLEAVDFVLRYRKRIQTINRQFEMLKQHLRQKEQEHQSEVMALRRQLAQLMNKGPL
jgi:DNA-binding transcriptional MerR regulator